MVCGLFGSRQIVHYFAARSSVSHTPFARNGAKSGGGVNAMLSPNISSRSRISRIVIYAIFSSIILLMTAERSNSAVFPFLDSVRELIGSTSQCASTPIFGTADNALPRTGPICASDAGIDTFTYLGAANAPFVTYQLSVSKSGTGGGTVTTDVGAINCGANCTATYEEGQMVAITATPDSTSQFAGWTGA